MNLLTNGFVNNSGRLFGPSEQLEADNVLGAERIRCERGGVRIDSIEAES